MDPITGALIGGGASLLGSAMNIRQQKDMQDQAAKQRAQEIDMIKRYGTRQLEPLTGAYQSAQDARQQGTNMQLALMGQTLQPRMEAKQAGDYMAQQAILAGLQGQRQAILGGEIDYSSLTPQNLPIDYSQLAALTSPQQMDMQRFTPTEFSSTGVEDWGSREASDYLNANPDVAADYARLRPQLLAGGDPQYATAQGYAKWHYDNYGRQENRPTRPTANVGTQFTPDQLRNALTRQGEQR